MMSAPGYCPHAASKPLRRGTMDEATAFARASDGYLLRAQAVSAEQWSAPTPCVEWDVRALMNHVAGEYLWVPELLAGRTIAEVGDRLDGDLLGDDPIGALTRAHAAAAEAAAAPDALTTTVHLSFGDLQGAAYLQQMAIDSVIHSWDLARGIGADEALDPDLVEYAYAALAPVAEDWRSGGAFGPTKEPTDGSQQARLIALTGR
jgi:uncharacterized protein (TIGR03086 family)